MAMVGSFGRAGPTEWVRWGGSLALVLVMHVAVSAAILNNISTPATPASQPSIVMIDLPVEAFLPVADSVESIAADAAAEVAPTETVEPIDPVVEEVAELVPEPVETIEPVVTEIREADIAELIEPVETVTAKPVEPPPEKKPEEKKKEVKKAKPRPKPQVASSAANNSRAASGASRQRSDIQARYVAEVRAAVFRHRRAVPPSVRGRATVSFVITAGGQITNVRLQRSSGSAVLDNMAVSAVRNTGRVKPIPREMGRSSLSAVIPFGRR